MSSIPNPLEIDCHSVHARLSADDHDFLLLDCREKDEYDLVHLPQAKLLPMSELAVRVGELEAYRDKEIVVLCHHGIRSLDVAMWLRQAGFADVKSISGGIDRWAQQIDPSLPRY